MRSAALKGKCIKQVHQVWFTPGLSDNERRHMVIDAIEFTDGSVLRFIVVEGDGDYGVEPIYPARAITKGGAS